MKKSFDSLKQVLINCLKDYEYEECTIDKYRYIRYPKVLSLMNFNVNQYKVEGFGKIMIMETKAMFGLINLTTISFMNNSGKDVPYLLIDTMSMKNKKLAYIEYYDCTDKQLSFSSLDSIKSEYADIADYNEQQAWYVNERMDCSLIKGGENASEEELFDMCSKSISAYLVLAKRAPFDSNNLSGLKNFQNRMITEGNPSSSTMEKALGKQEALNFFKTCVMPLE